MRYMLVAGLLRLPLSQQGRAVMRARDRGCGLSSPRIGDGRMLMKMTDDERSGELDDTDHWQDRPRAFYVSFSITLPFWSLLAYGSDPQRLEVVDDL